MKRVYILYSERSGSNLLRVLLGNHPALSAPVPPQFYDSFIPYLDRFGDLRKKENSTRAISLMKKYANHPFSDWKLDIKADEIYKAFKPSNFTEVVDALYSAKAQQHQKTGYVCKENHLFYYTSRILSSFQNIHWLYLHRDVRDVVSSWLKNNMLFFTAYKAAQSWKKEQQKCIALIESSNFNYHQMGYEGLVADTQKIMTHVLQYLEIAVVKQCFRNQQERAEAKRNVLWKNLDKPIDASNTRNYRKVLSQKQLLMVESICRQEMQKIGYELETAADWNPVIGKKVYELYNKFKELGRKTVLSGNKSSQLIQDRNKLKVELINGL